ncbi:hypothetical protein FRB94_008810 [Tulasnella sp. JGI-2019a]|nr:hypothetical protein FRB94_008810 [Tulasnella sp. JGI-2019a]
MTSNSRPNVHLDTPSMSMRTSQFNNYALDSPDMLSPMRGSDTADSPITPLNGYSTGSNLFIRKVPDTPVDSMYGGMPYALLGDGHIHSDAQPSTFLHSYDLSYQGGYALDYDSKHAQYLPEYFPDGRTEPIEGLAAPEDASAALRTAPIIEPNYITRGPDYSTGPTEQDLADYFGLAWPDVQHVFHSKLDQDARDAVSHVPRAYAKASQNVPLDVDIGTDDVWNEGPWASQQLPSVPMLAPPFSPPALGSLSVGPSPSPVDDPVATSPPPTVVDVDQASFPPAATRSTTKRTITRRKRVTDPAKPKRKPRTSPRQKRKSVVSVKDEAAAVTTAAGGTANIPPSPNHSNGLQFRLRDVPGIGPFGEPIIISLLGRVYSPHFPEDHYLDPDFVLSYHLEAEIGVGGFGFVMTARHRATGVEVAVKFIDKDKIPDDHIVEDISLGCFVPIEVSILRMINHKGVVKFLEFTQDDKFYYLVQELHGCPWQSSKRPQLPANEAQVAPFQLLPPHALYTFPPPGKTASVPNSSPLRNFSIPTSPQRNSQSGSPVSPATQLSHFSFSPGSPAPAPRGAPEFFPSSTPVASPFKMPLPAEGGSPTRFTPSNTSFESHAFKFPVHSSSNRQEQNVHMGSPSIPVAFPTLASLSPPDEGAGRPNMARRPSHDLFECIEQHKKLGEARARHVFGQIVDTVEYLQSLGISHRDIKDENLVVDADFNVKLIDFGSAVIRDVTQPEPYYSTFFGTVSFAASEILQDHAYRALPAEIWTLGVLLSFLVTGEAPFLDEAHAIAGIPSFSKPRKDGGQLRLSNDCIDLICGCLRPDPDQRFTIKDIKRHRWLRGRGAARS